ncbi:MAG: dihydrolipoyl dehydrogenase [Chitinispirillia bacterium]|nr:dihydrolipoyl dehydrogenase [Chitinispirillia bacterium]MCL2269310.1 dihydrolipoyl dehydrogenase [Chitinispirillia bacterium]
MSHDYDVLVIGSGPGGYVAAIRAAQLGKRAAVVERGDVGGVCLNIGCIPSKAIIHQAEIYRNRTKLELMGVRVDGSGFRYENVFNTSRRAAETLSKGVAYLLRKNKVELIKGSARIVSGNEVSVEGVDGAGGGDGLRKITAGAIIVAVGSRPKIIPGLEFDGKYILSSDDALMMKELPRRALIIGAGAIGMEFAHILNSFGAEVHIVEMAERILPLEDGEITAVVKRSFMKRGIKIYTSSKVSSHCINTNNNCVDAVIEGADGGRTELSADSVFVMTGRTPNTENIGLEAAGISTLPNGCIDVGDYYQTSVKSIYAIGDIVSSSPMLAHAASKAGEIAAEHIAGHTPNPPRINLLEIPAIVYCEPQTASFGLTEERASAKGVPFTKAAFPFRACGKAVAVDESDGMVKIMADPSTKRIIGAHIAGAGAAELIHELLLAGAEGINPSKIAELIHAHPTLSEAVMEAARALEGWAVHI